MARMIFRIQGSAGERKPQFDEQFRLIEAEDFTEAIRKAGALAKREEESFVNTEGHLVSWKFIGLTDVIPLNGMGDGGRIFSRTEEPDDALLFIHWIQSRSLQLPVEE